MNEKLYNESIILIGPSGTGKSTVAEQLVKKLNMKRLCLDTKTKEAREEGLDKYFKTVDEFNYFMIAGIIKKAKSENIYGIVDFGGGHSVYDDKEIFEKVKEQLKPFKNIVLLLPCTDEELSLEILNGRSTGDISDNLKFIKSSCNKELATITIYSNDRTPSDIADEIISRIEERKSKLFELER